MFGPWYHSKNYCTFNSVYGYSHSNVPLCLLVDISVFGFPYLSLWFDLESVHSMAQNEESLDVYYDGAAGLGHIPWFHLENCSINLAQNEHSLKSPIRCIDGLPQSLVPLGKLYFQNLLLNEKLFKLNLLQRRLVVL